jgi:hypothetical protein
MPAMTKRKTEREAEPPMKPPISVKEMSHLGHAAMEYCTAAGYLCGWIEPCKSVREFDASIKQVVTRWEAFKEKYGTAEFWQ